jgi:hypothetical protein
MGPARLLQAKENTIGTSELGEVGLVMPVRLWTSTEETAVLDCLFRGRKPIYRNCMLLFEATTEIRGFVTVSVSAVYSRVKRGDRTMLEPRTSNQYSADHLSSRSGEAR